MANSFTDDGAIGAGDNLGANSGQAGFGNSNFGGSAPTTGSPPPPPASGSMTDTQAQAQYGAGITGNGELNGMGGNYTQHPTGSTDAAGNFTPATASQLASWENEYNAGAPTMSFAQGGAVPTDDGDGDGEDTNGSPGQDAISKALDSVDAVLAYGRKLHGLGGGQAEDGGAIPGAQAGAMPTIPGNQSNTPGPYTPSQPPQPQQMAAGYGNGRMPAIPGNQSNSGAPPIQPQPGPLPPTSNPFGKRADAGDDGDGDDDSQPQGGAINTEETA